MKIAHLILAHTDLEHVKRLAERLLPISDVFIHIDKNTDSTWLENELMDRCHFVQNRLHCTWGGV